MAAEEGRREIDGVEVLGALSPSRAADFTRCALAFRLRTVDHLTEPPTLHQVRGTLVHQVLEELFDLPAADRTPRAAYDALPAAWAAMLEAEPALGDLFEPAQAPGLLAWLAECREALDTWFTLEDPTRLEPAEREVYVETLLESGLLLRGIVDRVDVAPDGAVRLVDYKTGRAGPEGREQAALFQLRFYALVWWRLRGVVPTLLQLVYLGSGETIGYTPEVSELEATGRRVEAVWAAIQEARRTGVWEPNPGWVCGSCGYHALCPAKGGTPPPLPAREPGRCEPQVSERA